MDLFDLTGKTILITGGAGHLGRAMSHALAAYHAHVFIASRDGEKCERLADSLAQEYGTNCDGISLDVSSENSIQSCLNCILKKTGRIDVLVNNASFSSMGFFEDITEDKWKEGIDGTVNSVFRMCSATIPHMVRQGHGNIINISSIWGQRGASCEAVYSASKGGIDAFTKAMAKELGPSGIRVNAISCGVIDTEMNDCFNQEEKEMLIDEISLMRIGTTEEVAKLALFLGEDTASFITGQIFIIDGGIL